MSKQLLISAEQLARRLESNDLLVVDCRFDLLNPDAGRQGWLGGHITGAVYAHLDDDLAGPVSRSSGRHPLPDAAEFASFLARSGWSEGKTIVACDQQGGAMSARLWWLMRYFGHDVVQLLDGGLAAWVNAGYELQQGAPVVEMLPVTKLSPQDSMQVGQSCVKHGLRNNWIVLLDARAPDRYAGLNESIDSRAGHVPGALNSPFTMNLDTDESFVDPSLARQRFELLLAEADPEDLVHMCGSGVTACHNLFTMELAGLGGSRLYPGSWSEWIRDENNPVATGPDTGTFG